jgi:hypothetical protein
MVVRVVQRASTLPLSGLLGGIINVFAAPRGAARAKWGPSDAAAGPEAEQRSAYGFHWADRFR